MLTKPRARANTPLLTVRPSQRMAVVRTLGDPNVVGPPAMSALYGAVYPIRFALKREGIDFAVGPLRARWPDAHQAPKEEWSGIWGLPVPDGTTTLKQKDQAIEVQLQDWEYGAVAELLHLGPFETETATIELLHRFITEQGYEIAGPHEEEYLTRPTAKQLKTIIRYQVRPVPG